MTTENNNKKVEEEVTAAEETQATTEATEEQVTNETEATEEVAPEEVPAEEIPVEETCEEKLAKLQDQHLRLTAEFDNYRKRTLKEKMELTKTAGERILINVIPVMDDFERARQNMDASDANSIKEGIELIYAKFNEFLKQNGVTEIEAQGQDFDTDHHEALTKIPAPSKKMKGKVVDVIQKGYNLNDKVIRFAKVVIGE